MVTLDISTVIGIVSAVTAVVSLVFAWKAVKTAERSNFAGLYTELHKIYQEPQTFNAIKVVWELYGRYEGSADGEMIPYQQAYEIVSNMNRDSVEWQSIHNMCLFWKYVSILVRKSYLDEQVAFKALTSPRMLGFLAPIESVFLEYHYGKVNKGDLPLSWLYNRWKKHLGKH